MKPEPRSEGRRWLVQAENDLRFAALASREGFFAHLSTRYPNSLPGGVPAEAFAAPDAERALGMAREVLAAVGRHLA